MSDYSFGSLVPDSYYHLFNRGNNRQDVFFQDWDYRLFLMRCPRFVDPVAEVYAYCLLPNHFHMLIRIRSRQELMPGLLHKDVNRKKTIRSVEDYVSDQFSNWFNSYTRTTNKYRRRDGNLFKRPFQRKEVDTPEYFKRLVRYIHWNPQYHGLVDDFRTWKYSSYHAMLCTEPTRLQREAVLARFGGVAGFRAWHELGRAVDDDAVAGWEGE